MIDHARETLLGASTALAWAARSGLLSALLRGPLREDELSTHLACDPRALALVLGVLEAGGWTRREGDTHAFADPSAEEVMARELWLWRQLDAFAETGTSFMPEDARDAIYPQVVAFLARRFARDAEALASALDDEPAAILDVGAGSGVWSLAMAARASDCSVTALDGPNTLEVFLRHAEQAGMTGRVEALAGDYHEIALPEGRFDRVILANVLHLETPPRAAALVARSARALAPSGTLVIVDAVSDPSAEDALTVAVYALHLGMRVPGSRVYATAELEAFARDARLVAHRWIPLSRGLRALVARAT